MRTLLLLIAVCGATLWAARIVWESRDPLRALARTLKSGGVLERIEAAEKLGLSGAPGLEQSMPALIGAMEGDSQADVRAASAGAVGELAAMVIPTSTDEHWIGVAISALLRGMTDARAEVRAASAEAIGRFYASIKPAPPTGPTIYRATAPVRAEDVVGALAARLGDREALVRLRAAEALRPVGPLTSLDPPVALLDIIDHEKTSEVRAAAVHALRGFPRAVDDVVPRLFRAYESGQGPVVSACSAILYPLIPSAALVPFLIERLDSPDRNVRWMAANTLGRMSAATPAIPKLLTLLEEPAEAAIPRGPGWQLVSGVDPSFFDPACRASWALGQLGPGSPAEPEIVPALARMVSSSFAWRQAHAAAALSRFGASAEPAIPALIGALEEALAVPGLATVGERAASALGRIAPGSPQAGKAVAVLIDAIDPEHATVRLEAVRALAMFGNEAAEAVPRLEALRDTNDTSLREAASDALAAIRAMP
jgi:HEAT repeat protein